MYQTYQKKILLLWCCMFFAYQCHATAIKVYTKSFKIYGITDSVRITLYEQILSATNCEYWVQVANTNPPLVNPTISSITYQIGLTSSTISTNSTFTVPTIPTPTVIYGIHGYATRYVPNYLQFVTNKSMPYPGSTFGSTSVRMSWAPGVNLDTISSVPSQIVGKSLISQFLTITTWIARIYDGATTWVIDVNPANLAVSGGAAYTNVVKTVPLTGSLVSGQTYYMSSYQPNGLESSKRWATVFTACACN